MPFRTLLLALLVLLPASWKATAQESPWERIVVVGASASAGFGTEDQDGRQADLAGILDLMLRPDHREPRDLSSSLFFQDPVGHGARQAELARRADPSLLVAVDFLFWSVYGSEKTGLQRIAHLEGGLRLLEGFDCPVAVSEVPDMHAAIGIMLRARQVPSPAELRLVNARIRAWAAASPERVVVPLVEVLRAAREGGAIPLQSGRIEADPSLGFLQRDRLHPTVRGLVALAAVTLDRVAAAVPGAGFEDLVLDREVIEVAVHEGWSPDEVRELAAPAPSGR